LKRLKTSGRTTTTPAPSRLPKMERTPPKMSAMRNSTEKL